MCFNPLSLTVNVQIYSDKEDREHCLEQKMPRADSHHWWFLPLLLSSLWSLKIIVHYWIYAAYLINTRPKKVKCGSERKRFFVLSLFFFSLDQTPNWLITKHTRICGCPNLKQGKFSNALERSPKFRAPYLSGALGWNEPSFHEIVHFFVSIMMIYGFACSKRFARRIYSKIYIDCRKNIFIFPARCLS